MILLDLFSPPFKYIKRGNKLLLMHWKILKYSLKLRKEHRNLKIYDYLFIAAI